MLNTLNGWILFLLKVELFESFDTLKFFLRTLNFFLSFFKSKKSSLKVSNFKSSQNSKTHPNTRNF